MNFFYVPVVWQSLKALGLKLTHVEVRGRRGWRESWRKWGRESVKIIMSVCIISLVFSPLHVVWSDQDQLSTSGRVQSFTLVSIHRKSYKHHFKCGVWFLAKEKVLRFSPYTSLCWKGQVLPVRMQKRILSCFFSADTLVLMGTVRMP